MILDWIVVKPERQGYGKSLKDSDGFQVWFGCDLSINLGVIIVW